MDIMNHTPATIAKAAGLKLVEVAEISGTSVRTLANWHQNKPDRFKAVVLGAAQMKAISDMSRLEFIR